MAIGVISSTVISTLSPGITISVPSAKVRHASHVRCTEVELGSVTVEERRVSAAFVLREDVRLSTELRVRRDRSGLRQNLTALYIVLACATEQTSHVVACATFVKKLPEHFDARDGRLRRVADAHDFNLVAG